MWDVPAHSGQCLPWAGGPGLNMEASWKQTWVSHSISKVPPQPWLSFWPPGSSPVEFLLWLPSVIEGYLKSESKITPSPTSCFVSYFIISIETLSYRGSLSVCSCRFLFILYKFFSIHSQGISFYQVWALPCTCHPSLWSFFLWPP